MDKLTGTCLTVTPSNFSPIVAEAVAVFTLLPEDFETVYQLLSYIVTLQVEDVHVALVPVYVKLPVKSTFQSSVPSLS